MILTETLRTCLSLGHTITIINWLENDLYISTKEDAIKSIRPLILNSIREFNTASCPMEYERANTNRINKAIISISKHFDNKNKETLERIADNFYRINIKDGR